MRRGLRPCRFSSGGTTLASGSRDGTVKLWDVGTRGEIGTLEAHASEVTSVSSLSGRHDPGLGREMG